MSKEKNYLEYRISNIADFLAVPQEKRVECLRDFKSWLDFAMQHSLDKSISEYLGGVTTLQTDAFTWVDDGQEGVTGIDIYEKDGEHIVRLNMEGGVS